MHRTFAMRVFIGAYVLGIVTLAYAGYAFIIPNLNEPEAAGFAVFFAIFGLLFIGVTVAAAFWRSAPAKGWFWLAGAVPAALFTLLNAPYLPYSLVRPLDASGFIIAWLIVLSGGFALVSGIAAFREVRRGAAAATPVTAPRSPVTRLAVIAIIAAFVGAFATAFAAGATGSGGTALAEAPTTTAVMHAKDTKFDLASLDLRAGQVLGLFVVNEDAFEHSFDIDALNVHVRLPAKSTVGSS